MTLKKIKKLINNPGVFFRDYFNKHYPLTYTELHLRDDEEMMMLLSEPRSLIDSTTPEPIDIVYTWVDNQDLVWQEKYHFHKKQYQDNNISVGRFALDTARFENNNELYYSIHSVKQNLTWIRNIYLVTDGQYPTWLHEFDNIFVIHHHEIIDSAYLPTFNSHVIEAHLHKIPNLSENFLYFNDDVFVAKPLPPSHFFQANGLASLFISAKKISDIQKRGLNTATLNASISGKQLLESHYDICIDNMLVHTYFPLKKTAYNQAWSLFNNEILRFLPNKFRTNHDLNMATFLVPWLMYCEKTSTEKVDVCYYFNIRSKTALTCYDRLLSKQRTDVRLLPHSFCANDFHAQGSNTVPDYKERLFNFLQHYFAN